MKTRSWTKRTMLAMFATALTAVGCNADQKDVVSSVPDKTAEAKQSIINLGSTQEGCSVRTLFDLRSANDIAVVALDAGRWAGEDLTMTLYEVNEAGEQTRVEASAVSLRHLIAQQSSAKRRDEAAMQQAATSHRDASSRSGRSATASELHRADSASASTAEEEITNLVEDESSFLHAVEDASKLNRDAVSEAEAAERERLEQRRAAEAEAEASEFAAEQVSEIESERADVDGFCGGGCGLGGLNESEVEAREAAAERASEAEQEASEVVIVDQESAAQAREREAISEDQALAAQEVLDTAARSLESSTRKAAATSATSMSSESLVATTEEEFADVVENEEIFTESSSLVDSEAAEESSVLEELEQAEEASAAAAERTMVFNNLKDLRSRHLILEVMFEGAISEANLDVFLGEEEQASFENDLGGLFSESFDTSFDACWPGGGGINTIGAIDTIDTLGVRDLEDLADIDDLGVLGAETLDF